MQGGIEGGAAAAELLCGIGSPSGKLADTFAKTLEDYPSSYNFHESQDYVDYTDDIYVGYRYFETIPGADKKVVYPFGYGLSYTTFKWELERVDEAEDGTLTVRVEVTNTGNMKEKKYFSCTAVHQKECLINRQKFCFHMQRQSCCSLEKISL